jgi:hypothetical protein
MELLWHDDLYLIHVDFNYIISVSPKWRDVRVSRGQQEEVHMQPVVLDMLEITSTCW